MTRNYWTTINQYVAHCQDCGWECEARNALGLAAQHHDKTKHTVHVDLYKTIVYETKEREKVREENNEFKKSEKSKKANP